MAYCKKEDVKALTTFKRGEISDPQVESIIGKAKADIDASLSTMYNTPFDNVAVHPKGVPEKIRWLTAEKAACIIHFREYDEGEPNQTDYGKNCHDRVEAQLKQLRECAAGLIYPDGTEVPRIGDCPQNSPGSGTAYVPIMSNTINDAAIFSLDDITDTETD